MVKEFDLDYILNRIDNIVIKGIEISNKEDGFFIIEDNDCITISLSSNYLLMHKSEVLNSLIEIIKHYKNDEFNIKSGLLVNDNIIDALCENDNINKISLAKTDFINRYSFSLDDYNKFKNAGKSLVDTFFVDEELKRNFDPMIGYNANRSIYSFYNYNDLQKGMVLIDENILEDKEYVFKYFGKDATINIASCGSNVDIKSLLEKLEKYNVQSKIIINVNLGGESGIQKNKINEALIDLGYLSKSGEILKKCNLNIEFNHLSLVLDKTYSIDEYLDYESLLYKIVEDAQNLSPLEKFIYAYDIVKRFKLYNTPKKDNKNVDSMDRNSRNKIKHVSRDLYDILENNYMVCVGYAGFLRDLLTKLGIDSCGYGFDVEISAYKAFKQIQNNNSDYNDLSVFEKRKMLVDQQSFIPHNSYGGHERVLVHLNDEKYGIDGLFFSDPTWDNDLINSSYAHCLMSEEDVSMSSKKPKLDENTLLFSATNIFEFNNMLNTCINMAIENKKLSNKNYLEYLKVNNKSTDSVDLTIDEVEIFYNFFKKFFSKLCLLFPDECNNIRNNHPCISSYNFSLDSIYELGDDVTSMIHDVGSLIVSKQNNAVSRESLRSAIKEVYSNIYENGLSDDDVDLFFKTTDDSQYVEFGSYRYK